MQIVSPFFAPYRQKKEDFFMYGKKTGKRLLSWVLVLIMALSMLPLNVLADEVGGDSVIYGHYEDLRPRRQRAFSARGR